MVLDDINSPFFKTAVHQCDDFVIITDNNALVVYVNPSFENATGFKLADVKGKNISFVKSGLHKNVFYKNVWKILQSGKAFSGIFINKKKNGDIFFENKTITPIKSKNGRITHYLSTSKDVTQEQNLINKINDQKLFINGILQTTDALIICTDFTGTVTLFNKACEKLTGYKSSEVVGKNFADLLLPKNDVEKAKALLRKIIKSKNKDHHFEGDWVTKAGRKILISWSNSKVTKSGGAFHVLSTGIDITKQRKQENKIKEINTYLGTEVKKRTKRLARLGEEMLVKNDLLRKIFVEVPAVIYLYNKVNGTVKIFNNAINDKVILAEKKGAVLSLEKFLGYLDLDNLSTAHKDFINSKKSNVELPFKINNSIYWCNKKSTVFKRGENNEEIEILGFISDVTNSKIIQEKLEESQRIAKIGTWEWDITNNDLYWSEEIFRIFGLNSNKIKPSYPKFLEACHPDDVELIKKAVDDSIKNKKAYEVVHRLPPKNGKIKFVREKGETIFDKHGQPLKMIGTVQDISKEVDLEAKLKTAFDTLENSLIPFITFDLQGRILSVNNSGLKMFNEKSQKSFLRHYEICSELFDKKHKDVIEQYLTKIATGEEFNSNLIFKINGHGEDNLLVKINVAQIKDSNNVPYAFSVAFFDVTREIEIKKEIDKQERKINLLHQNVEEVVFGLEFEKSETIQGKIFYLGGRPKELMGFGFEEIKKNPGLWLGSIHPDDLKMVQESNQLCVSSKKPVTRTYRLLHQKTKKYRWFEETMTPDFGNEGVLYMLYGSARDVTEHFEFERKLIESEERYRLLSDNNRDLITLRDKNGNCQFVSNSVERVLGYTQDEYKNINIFDLIHPDDLKRSTNEAFFPAFDGEKKGYTIGRTRHKDGHYVWMEVLTHPVVNSGEIKYVVSSARDITERKKLEDALQESEKKYRSIFDNALVAIFRTNIYTQRPVDVNGACVELFGYDSREDFLANFVASERYAYPEERKSFILDDAKKIDFSTKKVRFKRKNGSLFWGEASAKLIADEGVIEGVIIDVTKRHEYEFQLKENLEEKELLLKEIHHRVKNNLQIIISLLKLKLSNLKDENQRLPLIESQQRILAIAMVHEKLYLSEDISQINFSDYISSLTKSIQLLQKEKGVEVIYDLEDVFTNLNTSIPLGLICYEIISNAFKHAFKSVSHPKLFLSIHENKGSVQVKIADNGIGFNWKEIDLNKSLGWKLINSLSKQIKADLKVESHIGKGAEINISI